MTTYDSLSATNATTGDRLPRTPDEIAPQPEVSARSEQRTAGINVGNTEREISMIGGAAMVLLGLSRGSLGGLALAALGGAAVYRGVTGTCPLYSTLGMSTAGSEPTAEPTDYFERGIHVEQSMTINRTPEELYQFWHDFENLPRFMRHIKSVQVLEDGKSRWAVAGPAGMSLLWDAEIINDEKNSLIAWRSVGGADVDNAGSVRFVPGPSGRGTEVHVVIDYIPPARQVGRWVAKLFGEDPQAQIREDLRSFKALMESGEIPTTEGQPRGTCSGGGRRQMQS